MEEEEEEKEEEAKKRKRKTQRDKNCGQDKGKMYMCMGQWM
jgi:hypothetical protein